MTLRIRPYSKADQARALQVCIASFTPIHDGFRAALGEPVFELRYKDWKEQYAQTFDDLSKDDKRTEVYVAEENGNVVGFVFTVLNAEKKTGEIGLNAVDPQVQGQGVGKAMYEYALARLKARGAEIAYVGTGGDTAHAPARRAYEAVGFDKAIPAVHYFKVL
jgi:ribosomal protein S18 acetylase RimI-like enzyme